MGPPDNHKGQINSSLDFPICPFNFRTSGTCLQNSGLRCYVTPLLMFLTLTISTKIRFFQINPGVSPQTPLYFRTRYATFVFQELLTLFVFTLTVGVLYQSKKKDT